MPRRAPGARDLAAAGRDLECVREGIAFPLQIARHLGRLSAFVGARPSETFGGLKSLQKVYQLFLILQQNVIYGFVLVRVRNKDLFGRLPISSWTDW